MYITHSGYDALVMHLAAHFSIEKSISEYMAAIERENDNLMLGLRAAYAPMRVLEVFHHAKESSKVQIIKEPESIRDGLYLYITEDELANGGIIYIRMRNERFEHAQILINLTRLNPAKDCDESITHPEYHVIPIVQGGKPCDSTGKVQVRYAGSLPHAFGLKLPHGK